MDVVITKIFIFVKKHYKTNRQLVYCDSNPFYLKIS
jgi:hypothetical protein